MATVYTIGSSGKGPRQLFDTLRGANVNFLMDIRLNNTSQLAGYSKGDVLEYLCELNGIDYLHDTILAPTDDIRKHYNSTKDWNQYTISFDKLIKERQIERLLTPEDLNGTALLCACRNIKQCHRRLIAEYYQYHNPMLQIQHL